MAFTLDNFVRSILAVDAAVGDTSLVVALAAPPLRDPPAASANAPGILILQDQPTAPTKIEIVTYTGVSIAGTQVTLSGVTRGLEGTPAQAWTAGTQTFSGTTAAVLAQFALKVALATVATSGSYDDLADKPTLGTAAAADASAFATAAQGAEADAAMPKAGGTFTGLTAFQSPNDTAYHNLAQFGPGDVNKDLFLATANGQYKWVHNGWYGTGSLMWSMPGGSMTLDYNGNVSARNLSGTNTGDQDLSGYAPLNSPQLLSGQTGNGNDTYVWNGVARTSIRQTTGLVVGAGGTLTFGYGPGDFAYIRGCIDDAGGYQSGRLVLGTRTGTDQTAMTPAITIYANQTVAFTNTISAPNIGAAAAGASRTYVQSTDPGAVPDGALWVW